MLVRRDARTWDPTWRGLSRDDLKEHFRTVHGVVVANSEMGQQPRGSKKAFSFYCHLCRLRFAEKLLISDDDENRMPPADAKPLSRGEIETIKQWIEEGAPPFPRGE